MRVNNRQAIVMVANRQEFTSHTASLRGEVHTPGHVVNTGRMPRESAINWQPTLTGSDFIVWSYGTPIGWHIPDATDGRWIIPETKYSGTTSRHQSALRQGAGVWAE